MRAAILSGPGAMTIEEVALDGPGPGEVRVQITACGVCHSDLYPIFRAREGALAHPVILGHEAAGVVEAVGSAVRSVREGDPVVLAFRPSCGGCFQCGRGEPQLCERPDDPQRGPAGAQPRLRWNGRGVQQGIGVGGFAESCVMPEGGVVKIRSDAPLGTVCLIGCGVTTGIGAVIHTARIEPGSDVAVIGLGGVGLNIVQGARLAGARRIIAIDRLQPKLELAAQFGATDLVLAGDDDLVEQVRKITPRLDYAFEAIGLGRTVAQALAMVRPGGTAVAVGVTRDPVTVPGNEFLREKKLIGSLYGSARIKHTIPRLVDLYMEGRIQIDELVSRRRPLAEINEAFADLESGVVARTVIELR
jgi:S-(hydroxymethyl)glutathione dehydrogenase/alcohol dehydrogenase